MSSATARKLEKTSARKSSAKRSVKRAKAKTSAAREDNENVIDLFDNPKAAKHIRMTEQTREQLVLHFRTKARRLGRSILRRWQSRMDLAEVDSIVDLSLCEAVQRFDPSKGASFMTFLYYHLKGNLIRAVSAAANANLVPSLESEIEQASTGDQARAVNALDVVEALNNSDQPLPDEALLKKQMIRLSKDACDKLDPLEQEVIERIYLQGEQLMDIAASLGYSRCHISRVKKKALESLYEDLDGRLALPGEREEKLGSARSKRTQRRRSRVGKPQSEARERLVAQCS